MSATPAQLAAFAQGPQTDAATAYETRTGREAVGDADRHVTEVLAAAAGLWVAAFGSVSAAGTGAALARLLVAVTEQVERALAGLGDRARRAVLAALPGALSLGGRQAREFVRRAGHRPPGPVGAGRPRRELLDTAENLAETVRQQMDRVLRLLSPDVVGDRFPVLAAGIAAARSVISRVRAAVAWLVHSAVSDGATAVADRARLSLVWVAELDACVRCLAYSGAVTGPGEEFDGGRSFDPQQRGPAADTVESPPLHPHCRCRLVPWSPSWAHDGPSLPDYLQGQAAESVARGWALPSESGAARVRAARALLASGRRLPPHVARLARRAVRDGHFEQHTAAR